MRSHLSATTSNRYIQYTTLKIQTERSEPSNQPQPPQAARRAADLEAGAAAAAVALTV